MAKSAAQRQREWRQRQREKKGAVPVMPCSDYEAFRAGAAAREQALREQVAALEDQLEGQEAGKADPRCPACRGSLACPQCYQGGGHYADDF